MAKDSNKSITAVIITKNEEKSISLCLASLQHIADEVIVVDSFSTDKTREICEKFSVKFLPHAWEGYAKTKNWGNAQASHDLILSLDADEVLSPELQKSILEAKNSGDTAWELCRITNYCCHWIRHGGWYPEWKLRLFDRREAQWEGDYVHEKLVLKSGITSKRLMGDCFHYTYSSIADHIAKVNHFSTLAAEERFARGKRFSILKMIFSPLGKFIGMYFIKLGFLDGRYGLILAAISAFEKFLRQAKLYQMGRDKGITNTKRT